MRTAFWINKPETGVDEIESETARIVFHWIIFDLVCSAEKNAGDSLDALPLRLVDFASGPISILISIRIAKWFSQQKYFSLSTD